MAKIRDDAPNSLSLGRVMGEYPDGSTRLEYEVFVPGQDVPQEYLADVQKSLDDKDSHLHDYLEQGSKPKRVAAKDDEEEAPKAKTGKDNPFTDK